MRVLLDECLPHRLRFQLPGHQVVTTQEAGLSSLSFALVVMSARSNRMSDLAPHVPSVLEALRSIKPGDVVKVGV